jgi:16S rRNA (uracil1498-N3)-methyltransferase
VGAGNDPGALSPSTVDAAAQVFVADLDAPGTTSDDDRHLRQVLRLRPGEVVLAADGRGRWRRCLFTGSPPRGTEPRGAEPRGAAAGASLEPDGPVCLAPRPSPAVTVGFVPVKGGRPEWVVQKLTEAGVDHIAVLRAARSVVRWEGERLTKALDRLDRVAREAAAQSRRAWLPDVTAVGGPRELVAQLAPLSLAIAQPGGDPLSPGVAALAVGPEGGWDDAEAEVAPRISLGPTILRAETAAMAAGVLLCALRAGVVAPASQAGPVPLEGPRI